MHPLQSRRVQWTCALIISCAPQLKQVFSCSLQQLHWVASGSPLRRQESVLTRRMVHSRVHTSATMLASANCRSYRYPGGWACTSMAWFWKWNILRPRQFVQRCHVFSWCVFCLWEMKFWCGGLVAWMFKLLVADESEIKRVLQLLYLCRVCGAALFQIESQETIPSLSLSSLSWFCLPMGTMHNSSLP